MTPTTRSQARKQSQPQSKLIPLRKPEDARERSGNPDRVENYATMIPAFVTAPVPLKILDELIEESKNGLRGLIDDDEGNTGYHLCILDTMDLNSVEHGSRTPVQPFESPFIGWTDDECRSWMNEHRHPYFATYTFVVLDKDTVKNKTIRIGYLFVDEPQGDQMMVHDFYTSMHSMPALEIGNMTWSCNEEFLGTGKVYNRQKFEEGQKKAYETYLRMERERKENEAKTLAHLNLL
ncbi:hypothetical protein V490_07445 [Pseudogymnoascus sp. VKM F-3557]|nr:hypothetical protein V490_07445 [Pseudogymnoascus sp. VKM F-3557]